MAVNKYGDHLPLERQARVMAREGLIVESQTLWDQIEALATALQPTYGALRHYVLTAPVIGADETWWRLFGGPQRTRWWAWSLTREDAVTYTILDSRSQEAAREVLNGYRGIVVADGYGAYDALARAGPSFLLAHCWAHVRRKFVEAESHYPEPCAEVLELIGQLDAVERTCPGIAAGVNDACRTERLALRATARREQSAPIVAAIRAWAHRQRALPESSLGKAIAYMLGLWRGLTCFLDDPRIALDNNATERALRGMVIGRKNHYGSRSKRGTEVAALFYSLRDARRPRESRNRHPAARAADRVASAQTPDRSPSNPLWGIPRSYATTPGRIAGPDRWPGGRRSSPGERSGHSPGRRCGCSGRETGPPPGRRGGW